MSFNPKVKDFLEKNPGKTMIGFYWSLIWRFFIVVLGIEIVLIILFCIITALISFLVTLSH